MFTTLEKQKNKEKRTNFRLVAIDETHHYTDENFVKACGKIFTVYFYNKNEITHLCELTGSYYLIPLYSYAENDVSDEIKDELDEIDARYGSDPIYVHAHQVDSMKTVKAPASLNGRYWQNDGRKYREIYEQAEEYLRGNHQI